MCTAVILAFLIQALGVGCRYVFLNGEGGERLDTSVEGSRILKGMKTDAFTAETLEEINTFLLEKNTQYAEKNVILYGNIPGLAYYLDKAPAIYTTWPDLDTNSYERLVEDLESVTGEISKTGNRPLVILSSQQQVSENEMQQKKRAEIERFMIQNQYTEVFSNEKFVVYE